MHRFATIIENAPAGHTVLVWEETEGGACKVVERGDEAPGGLDVYAFDVQTTFSPRVSSNAGKYPVSDAKGAPLWPGARISFRIPTHYINTAGGEGTFKAVDAFGGAYFDSDEPLNVYSRTGFIEAVRREQTAAVSEYQYEGPQRGFLMLARKLGDRHEHGQTDIGIELTSDPRSVCSLVPPVPRP